MEIFPDPSSMNVYQLLFMMIIYGVILLKAASLIGLGCEMLVLIYGSGIIGSLLIPILGALPDSLIILLSGLGSGTKEEIQQSLSVGVGTLVGSTVMLLTIPWGYAVYLGRRDIDETTGHAKEGVEINGKLKPVLTHFSLFSNGVTTTEDVIFSAKILALMTVAYWVIQIPAFFFINESVELEQRDEKPYVLVTLIVSLLSLAAYCGFQLRSSNLEEKERVAQQKIRLSEWRSTLNKSLAQDQYQEMIFKKYAGSNELMDAKELAEALVEMGLKVDRREVTEILKEMDIGDSKDPNSVGDGNLNIIEFKQALNSWLNPFSHFTSKTSASAGNRRRASTASILTSPISKPLLSVDKPILPGISINNARHRKSLSSIQDISRSYEEIRHQEILEIIEEKEEEEEEEKEEENFWELSDSQIKLKAIILLIVATAIAAIFSDPMVDVINEFGQRINISPFYVSFVITPIASNASEVIAGLQFASKKTTASLSLCHSSLLGGASMNASMSLFVFMCLMYFRELTWNYTAEVITVSLVTFIVAFQSCFKTVRLWQGIFVGSLYFLSVILIWILTTVGGLK